MPIFKACKLNEEITQKRTGKIEYAKLKCSITHLGCFTLFIYILYYTIPYIVVHKS